MSALALAAALGAAGFASAAPTDSALVKRAPNTLPAIFADVHPKVRALGKKLSSYFILCNDPTS